MNDPSEFLVTEIEHGGVIVHKASGQLVALKRLPYQLVEQLTKDSLLEDLRSAVMTYGTLATLLENDATCILKDLSATPAPGPRRGEFFFEGTGSSWSLLLDDRWVLRLDDKGTHLTRNVELGQIDLLATCAVMPKVLTLQGVCVLHASAVLCDGLAHVFIGDSGAGKTTLAHVLGTQGLIVLSEDKLIIRVNEKGTSCLVGSEPFILDEAGRLAHELSLSTTCKVREDLQQQVNGMKEIPVATFNLISPNLRWEDVALRGDPMNAPAATAALTTQIFQAKSEDAWPELIKTAYKLCVNVPTAKLWLPDKVRNLEAVAVLLIQYLKSRAGLIRE